MEFLIHWLIILVVLAVFAFVPTYLLYRHGRSVGEKDGYIRGYKKGQEANKERK